MDFFSYIDLSWLTMTLGAIALGLLGYLHLAWLREKRPAREWQDSPSPSQFLWLVFLAYLAGAVAAKMTAILCNLPRLVKGADPLEVWRSAGLVSFGGYAASIAAIILYCRLKAHDTLKALDIVFAYMGAFDIFQRVGCIFMGCCRGKPLMDTLGSPLNYIAGALGLARHPFPFYMLLLGLALLLWAAPALKRPHRPGEIFLKYFMFYSSIRFFLEFLRQEPVLAWLKPLTAPQAVCIVIFVTTFITLRQMRNKKTLNPKSETLNKS